MLNLGGVEVVEVSWKAMKFFLFYHSTELEVCFSNSLITMHISATLFSCIDGMKSMSRSIPG